jgi:hypothetical protein
MDEVSVSRDSTWTAYAGGGRLDTAATHGESAWGGPVEVWWVSGG